MKLSQGLNAILSPLLAIVPVPVPFFQMLRKVGKRGNKNYYPNDLNRMNVILESWHDASNRLFSVRVENNNLPMLLNCSRIILKKKIFCSKTK